MNSTSNIIKSLIVPLVIKFSKGDVNSLSDNFWYQFATDFIHYETNASPTYASLYKLELQNPEDVFEKLPQVYSAFINELAEGYVLGNENELTDKLLENNNETFIKEVTFLKTMKAVIIKTERNQLKEDLPQAYDRLAFELDEEILKQVSKKKSREDLRVKFKQWDEEMLEREPILNESLTNYNHKQSVNKVISLSWIKYTVAACIVLTAGFIYFKFNNDNHFVQPIDNNVVTTPIEEKSLTHEIPSEVLAEIITVTKNTPVIESSLGFASNEQNIKIIENNQRARIQSIAIAINKYHQFLKKELTENKVGYGPVVKEIESKIYRLKNELALLKEREKQYVFDGKSLVLFVSNTSRENAIVFYEDTYYLKRETIFYKLTIAKQPQLYKKENDSEVLNKLDKIYNGY